MLFANPLALWLLTLLPALVALHLFVLKRPERPIPSLLLWRQVNDQRSLRRMLAFLLDRRGLLLQLAVVLLFVLALSAPQLRLPGRSWASHVVVVLDASASMNAAYQGATRFERGRIHAQEVLRSLPQGTRATVVLAKTSPLLVSPFSLQPQVVAAQLDSLRCSDEPNGMGQSLALAATLAGGGVAPDLYIITDGAFKVRGDEIPPASRSEVFLTGDAAANQAITFFQSRRAFDAEGGVVASLEVRNFSLESAERVLRIEVDGRSFATETLKLEAGGKYHRSWRYTGAPAAVMKVSLEGSDALSADDSALVVLTPRRPRVAVVSEGNWFLQRFFDAFGSVTVQWANSLDDPSIQGADLVILDGIVPQRPLPPGRWLLLGVVEPDGPVAQTGVLSEGMITGWQTTEPLFESMRLDLVAFVNALQLRANRRVRVLAMSGSNPVILSYNEAEKEVLLWAFHPQRSNIIFTALFPLLMVNSISFLQGDIMEPPGALVPGSLLELTVSAGQKPWEEQGPDGRWLSAETDGLLLRSKDTSRAGLYRFRNGAGLEFLAAMNLTDADESSLSPRPEELSALSSQGVRGESWQELDLSWIAIVLGLAALVTEWVFWRREGCP